MGLAKLARLKYLPDTFVPQLEATLQPLAASTFNFEQLVVVAVAVVVASSIWVSRCHFTVSQAAPAPPVIGQRCRVASFLVHLFICLLNDEIELSTLKASSATCCRS